MIRMLVYGMTDNLGGMETFMLSYIRGMKDRSIIFDFISPYSQIAIEEQIVELGGKVYHLPNRKKHYVMYHRIFNKIMREHAKEYDAVWLNDCMFCNLDVLKYAKKYNIRTRILHAHNSEAMGSKSQLIRHTINKLFLSKYATHFFACSDLAAKWSYPNEVLRSGYRLIPNAIDINKYCYRKMVRHNLRSQMGLTNRFVIGNVGRLHFQKNQEFIIDVFNVLKEQAPEAVLLLIGTGEDEDKLRKKVKGLHLEKKIQFLGLRKDVPDLLQVMDVFFMPSQFEGLGIVSIEAQTSGLPCIMSDVIPKETAVTSKAEYISLEAPLSEWVEKILEYRKYLRKDERESVSRHGFDITTASHDLYDYFVELGLDEEKTI